MHGHSQPGNTRVLLVEDDLHMVQSLLQGLRAEGLDVTLAMDGGDAVELASSQTFDLVVLDLMLPNRPGFDVLDVISSRSNTPVIVLTAQSEVGVRLEAFKRGAADYVAKPFYMEELVARIRVRLSIPLAQARRELKLGAHTIDTAGRRVLLGSEDVGLTPAQYNLLLWLVERPNRAITRSELAVRVLDVHSAAGERSVDSHISRLRNKLGEDGRLISTVWRIGYRFEAPSTGPLTLTDRPKSSPSET